MGQIAVIVGLLMVLLPFVPFAYCYFLQQTCQITLMSAASFLLVPIGCALVLFGGVSSLGPSTSEKDNRNGTPDT